MKMSELNQRINFMQKVEEHGPVKNLEGTYELVLEKVWAKKITLLGKESIELGREHHTVRVNFIIRNRNDLMESMFIQHRGIIYNIIGFESLKADSAFMLIATVRK